MRKQKKLKNKLNKLNKLEKELGSLTKVIRRDINVLSMQIDKDAKYIDMLVNLKKNDEIAEMLLKEDLDE